MDALSDLFSLPGIVSGLAVCVIVYLFNTGRDRLVQWAEHSSERYRKRTERDLAALRDDSWPQLHYVYETLREHTISRTSLLVALLLITILLVADVGTIWKSILLVSALLRAYEGVKARLERQRRESVMERLREEHRS